MIWYLGSGLEHGLLVSWECLIISTWAQVRPAAFSLLKTSPSKGLGFRGLGFRGLGFKGLGFRGLGFRV